VGAVWAVRQLEEGGGGTVKIRTIDNGTEIVITRWDKLRGFVAHLLRRCDAWCPHCYEAGCRDMDREE
jgi:hypothetical protein